MTTSATTERHTTRSAQETADLGAKMAAQLEPGDVVALRGELGGGKTVFVRGAANELGYAGRVTSPTFAIGNVYEGSRGEIAHLDLYRLAEISLTDEAVLDDFLTEQRFGFVEWPHDDLAGHARLRAIISFEHLGDDRRAIEIVWSER